MHRYVSLLVDQGLNSVCKSYTDNPEPTSHPISLSAENLNLCCVQYLRKFYKKNTCPDKQSQNSGKKKCNSCKTIMKRWVPYSKSPTSWSELLSCIFIPGTLRKGRFRLHRRTIIRKGLTAATRPSSPSQPPQFAHRYDQVQLNIDHITLIYRIAP